MAVRQPVHGRRLVDQRQVDRTGPFLRAEAREMLADRRTDRLLLRRWRETDLDPFAAMCADPEVMRYFPATLTREGSAALITRNEHRFDALGHGLWALERRDDGAFIGFAGLIPMPPGVPGEGGIEIGWRLARAAWGHGFATEAARSILAAAFDELSIDEVHSITAVGNLRSQAVMERIGLVERERFEHPALPADSPLRPHVRYSLRPDER